MIHAGMTAIDLPETTRDSRREVTDEALLRQIAAGNDVAMQELVRRYQGPLYRFLTRFLGSSDDAEQAVLNVFVRVWQNAGRFEFRSQVSTWLYRIAFNIARDMHAARKARPQQESLPEEYALCDPLVGNAEDEAMRRIERAEQYRQLQEALGQLNEMDRLLLVLYYFEDSSYEEMQNISGLSYKVLKTRLSRARQRLRALLGQES